MRPHEAVAGGRSSPDVAAQPYTVYGSFRNPWVTEVSMTWAVTIEE